LPEADKRHLEYVISEVSRINDLITEFLDFAKPNAPLRVLQPARALVEEILGFLPARNWPATKSTPTSTTRRPARPSMPTPSSSNRPAST